MRSLFLPKNAAPAGSSLGEKEELDAYDEGVRARLDDEPGDFALPKSGWAIATSCSMRAATVADHLGESSPSGVLAGTTQHRSRHVSVGLKKPLSLKHG